METTNNSIPFLEILTGIIVAFIIFTFGVPKWMGEWNHYEIDQEVHLMVDNLIKARNTAVNNRHNVYVHFNPAKGSYRIHEDMNNNRKEDAGEPVIQEKFASGLQFGVDNRIAVKNIWGSGFVGNEPLEFSRGSGSIHFNDKGQASSDGAVYVRTPLRRGEEARMWAVRILKASGKITELEYQRGPDPFWN